MALLVTCLQTVEMALSPSLSRQIKMVGRKMMHTFFFVKETEKKRNNADANQEEDWRYNQTESAGGDLWR